ncbi:MAG: D-aminoacyl-tRNA deacylase [Vulcanimicrobiaceae bacterium]
MRAVVQRVACASVRVAGHSIGDIAAGMLVFVGVAVDDTYADADWMAEKLVHLRIFKDALGAMNRSLLDTGGAMLLVSQFTLLGNARKGRRPSFIQAAKEPLARPLYERVGAQVKQLGVPVAFGEFGAHMDVELVNDGPVTLLLDSKR